MPTQDAQDMVRELRSTKSVRSSTLTLLTSIEQRLTMAIDAGDMAAIRAIRDDLASDSRDALADAISAGTVAEKDDTDPSAPPPQPPGAAVAGGNVYGSGGASDLPPIKETDVTPKSDGADAAAPAVDPTEVAGLKDQVASLSDKIDGYETKLGEIEKEIADMKSAPPSSPQPPIDNGHVAPGATKFDELPLAATKPGDSPPVAPAGASEIDQAKAPELEHV